MEKTQLINQIVEKALGYRKSAYYQLKNKEKGWKEKYNQLMLKGQTLITFVSKELLDEDSFVEYKGFKCGLQTKQYIDDILNSKNKNE